jgi:DNA-binding SARP family transcriptional activator
MRFRVLGPLEFLDDGEWRRVGAAKWRTLLAVLLAKPDRVVSADRIAVELWGERPPKTVDNQIYGYVARLRRLLKADRDQLLVTCSPGYRLCAGFEDIDAGRFTALAEQGRAALRAGDAGTATRHLDAALALWRGSPFEDVPATPMVQAEADRLTEARAGALEDWAEAQLALGEHAEVVSRLADFVPRHPLRERLRELQMLALYRQGRQADALAGYLELRTLLAEELGVDPGQSIRHRYEQIVRADPALTEAVSRVDPVRQLPPDIPDFAGRAEELARVSGTVSSGSEDGPPSVVVLTGAPGVGKSSLAVHAAHALAARFPDGQLYLDLAGTSPRPRDPAVLLAEMLGAVGVRGEWIPDDLRARAALYRSTLARRRMLIVLDDADSAGQVRPLLPSTGSCAVIITTRRPISDLSGTRHVDLDVFEPATARELFTSIVGESRVAAEPEQADAILRACGNLPLAIRISGAKLAGRPKWPLRVLAERLDNESQRLDELRVGELGVRASFELSLRSLPADAVRGFALLGLFCGPVPSWVLGPLVDRAHADDIMDLLLDANLVQISGTDETGQPRYRLPGLLRDYAAETAATYPLPTRHAAVAHLLATWLDLAEHAAGHLPPSLFRPTPGAAPRRPGPADVRRRAAGDPLGWFDAERATVLDAVALAADWGLHEAAWELAVAMVPYYDLRSLHQDWLRGHEIALGTVREAGNGRGEAVLLNDLAQVQIYRDQFDSATPNLHRSLALYQQAGDRRGEALATAALATIERVHGRYEHALDQAITALDLVIATGDQHIEAQLRNGVARIHLAQGRTADARAWFDEALALSRKLGDVHREAVVLREMSRLYEDSDEALQCLQTAHDIFDDLHDERCVAYTLLRMGRVHAGRRDSARTAEVLTHAAKVFERDGDRMGEASCWQLLGELDIGYEDPVAARTHLSRALQLWQTFGKHEAAVAVAAQLQQLQVGRS